MTFDTIRYVCTGPHVFLGFEKDGAEIASLRLIPDDLRISIKSSIIGHLYALFGSPNIRILSYDDHLAELLAAELAGNERLHADLGITVADEHYDGRNGGFHRLHTISDQDDYREVRAATVTDDPAVTNEEMP